MVWYLLFVALFFKEIWFLNKLQHINSLSASPKLVPNHPEMIKNRQIAPAINTKQF